MAEQTVTRAVECEHEAGEVYKVLSDATNLPKWAPVFADAVEHLGERRYRVTKAGASFEVEVSLQENAGTVDFLRPMGQGRRGGAYMRVAPRPLSGSTITMTVPIGPNGNPAETAKILEKELATLIQLV
jgi:hypothetical protein